MVHDFGAVTDGETEIHLVGALFGKEDRENFVINQALNQRGGGGQNFIEIERRIDFLAELSQDFERVRGDVDFWI